MPVDPRIQAALDAPLRQGANQSALPRHKTWRDRGYFMAPGSGPLNEKCLGCAQHRFLQVGRKTVSKCALSRQTRSMHSDISMHSPACSAWEAKPK